MNIHQSSSRGFSLLEITFVILLISITVVSSALYIRSANQKAAAKQVAMQVNYWLNAAVNYYSVRDAWPDSLDTLASSVGQDNPPQRFIFLANNDGGLGKGAGIQVNLPSEEFALMVKALLPRALVEPQEKGASLFAYTPPVATLLPVEASVKGVGYLNFYNCKFKKWKHEHSKTCLPDKSSRQPVESPCLDPANSQPYKFGSSSTYYYQDTDSQFLANRSGAGVCVMQVPTCLGKTVPQIFYAISQFRAPFALDYVGKNGHQYQTYPYQLDIMCQAHSKNGDNLGPCGPNIINTPKEDDPDKQLKYWAISITLRNYQFIEGINQGITNYSRRQTHGNWGGTSNQSGTFYDEHSDKWSAMVSYVVACIPTAQIDGKVSGGAVRYMDVKNSCYSQDLMGANTNNDGCKRRIL